MNWNDVASKMSPYIVKIETPEGSGTGFLFIYSEDKSFCGIATALHVVQHAEKWQQPIKIVHQESQKTRFLPEADRTIFPDQKRDSAVIIFDEIGLPFPENLIPLLPTETPINIGSEVGWLGYPAIASNTLCFFSGNISARREVDGTYLIDGVAINGVSGGPVMYATETEGVQIVGIISAYRVNRLGSDALPGLSIAQDVFHFHKVIKTFKSVDEARRKKEEIADTSEPEITDEPTPT